jgi:hypothetical protein
MHDRTTRLRAAVALVLAICAVGCTAIRDTAARAPAEDAANPIQPPCVACDR